MDKGEKKQNTFADKLDLIYKFLVIISLLLTILASVSMYYEKMPHIPLKYITVIGIFVVFGLFLKKQQVMKSERQLKILVGFNVVFLIIIVGLYFYPTTANEPISTPTIAIKPAIKINYNSTTAPIQLNMTGTAKNISEGYKLWALVYPYKANKYYPQYDPITIQNGIWTAPVTIGTKDNIGDKFDIIAVLANQSAQIEFTSYLINCNKNSSWPGMDAIPDGAEIFDKITIIRV